MMKYSEMNGNQKYAAQQVKHAWNWTYGGYENSIMDGYMTKDELPSWEQMVAEIYQEVVTTTHGEGFSRAGARDEVKFAGKAFIVECIEHLMNKDKYPKAKATTPEVTEEKHDKIIVKAFTGMNIGTYEFVYGPKESNLISVTTKEGKVLTFNINTKVQDNPNNAKFANRFEWA